MTMFTIKKPPNQAMIAVDSIKTVKAMTQIGICVTFIPGY